LELNTNTHEEQRTRAGQESREETARSKLEAVEAVEAIENEAERGEVLWVLGRA
jgi:hypothetical protein